MKDFGTRINLLALFLSLSTLVGCSALNANQPTAQQKGTATSSTSITLNPKSISFGNVLIGQTQTQTVTISNPGVNTLTITHAAVSGGAFSLVGMRFPLVLRANQSASIEVSFTPTTGGANTGTISLMGTTTIKFNRRRTRVGSESPTEVAVVNVAASLKVPVLGNGMLNGQVTASPAALALGKVKVGASQTQTVALVNTSASTVTVKQASVSGRGFRMSGLSFPTTLSPGQRKNFNVTFTPQSTGTSSGTVAVTTDGSNPVVNVPVTATAVSSTSPSSLGALSTSDSSLDFSNVAVGSSSTLSETITNTGSDPVNLSQAAVSGTGFKITGLSLPLTLSPGQSFTFGTVFAPTIGGSATGLISVVSDASNPTVSIAVRGTATVSGQLTVSPGTLSFGSVVVGQSKSLTGSLTATGSSITVTGASMSTSEFTVSGLSLPVTLAAGKSISFTINFKPQSSGVASAGASFTSNASNLSAQATLTGTGTAAPQHSVALSWSPSSTSSVVGYNIYRGMTSGGPYSKIGSLNPDTTYTDGSLQAGQTYFYVTTAVDDSGQESAKSNQTQAAVPTP